MKLLSATFILTVFFFRFILVKKSKKVSRSHKIGPGFTSNTIIPSIKQFLSYPNFLELISEHKIAAVLFTSIDKTPKNAIKTFKKIKKTLLTKMLPFIHVQLNETEIKTEDLKFGEIPCFYIYIDSVGRKFNGEFVANDIALWLKEAIVTDVFAITDISQIHSVDSHFFAYASSEWHEHNQPQLESLAKLIYPIGLYTGLNFKQETKIFGKKPKKTKLWVYRRFEKEVIAIDHESDVEHMIRNIIDHEHLKKLSCDDHALQLIKHIKIPLLVFFESEIENYQKWTNVISAAEKFHEYLTPILVGANLTNNCSLFLNNFLEVEKKPSLRILNIHGKIKRHLFVGNFEVKEIVFFLKNYIHGNLKNYRINELINNEKHSGFAKLNTKGLKELLLGSNFENLIYVYEPRHGRTQSDLELLLAFKQGSLESLNRFRIFTFNAEKNDIGDNFLGNTPFLFVVKSDGKTVKFDSKFGVKNLESFLLNEFKELIDSDEIESL